MTGTATVNGEAVKQSTPAIPLTIVEAPFIVTVEPLRFSIVFPSTTKGATVAVSGGETVAIASNPTAAAEVTESEDPTTKDAMLTLTIVRQGGFTDELTLTPINVPEGFTTEAATIPAGETEVEVPLKALSSLKADTYQFKFRGAATINDNVFEQDSPVLNVKIIH